MDLLGRPRQDVIALTMPGPGTSERTHANARTLAGALGATLRTIAIDDVAARIFAAIGHDPVRHDVTYEKSRRAPPLPGDARLC